MKKILTIPSYIWAIACLLLIPVTFIKNDVLAEQLARLPFMKIHPRYSGGDERISYISDSMNIVIQQPVYEGITGKGKQGFVQVKFRAIGKLPAQIDQDIDYNLDRKADFRIMVDTKNGQTEIKSLTGSPYSLNISSPVKTDWVVRVNVER
jgi:hypothetical protein